MDSNSLHSIGWEANPIQVYTKPHQVRDTPALNLKGRVAKNDHGLVNANCTLYGVYHKVFSEWVW